MTSGVTCQVRFTRLLKPDSLPTRFCSLRLKLYVGVTWQPLGSAGKANAPKQPKLADTLPAERLSNLNQRVPAVRVSVFGIRSKSNEPKNAVCLVWRIVSW